MNNLISSSLSTYLGGTRLSMDQVAKKWNISTAMLSQIKNGKKRAGIDLGLKILRENGTDIETRKQWLDSRKGEESSEYLIVKEELQKKKIKKNLQEEFSKLLENEPALLDIFLDIAIAEDKGITWNSIYKNYGEYGTGLVESLEETGLVRLEDNRFFIDVENAKFITNELTSFGIVKAIIEMQKTRKKRGQFEGELRYNISDISKDAFSELIELNLSYVEKTREIIDNNEVHRLKGGVRVICQSLVSIAKGSLCLLLVFNLMGRAEASGIEGGSSSKSLGGIEGGSSSVIKSIRKPRDFFGKFGRKYMYEKTALLVTQVFNEKQVAVDSMVELNKDLENGNFDKKVLRRISIRNHEKCRGTTLDRIMKIEHKKATIKPIGFNVTESFNGKGEPRYSVKGDYYVPCEKKVKD
jgi:transcriptional regulator with XRE-family HTH domain